MAESKFARDQMEKYGWASGSGLGKDQQGMLNPIKVSVKNNKKGVGHDPGKEFTNNWWDQMFNKTARSISVDNHEDGVSVKTVIKEKKETKKSALYGNFIKTATLTNSVNGTSTEVRDESLVEEEVLKSSKYIVSDEEMFRKCGGRTAHKGARHGLKLNGKLQRIEEHEAMLMRELLKRKNTDNGDDGENESKSKKKKKKKNKEKESVSSGVCEDIKGDNNVDSDEINENTRSKSHKKKKRSKLEAESEDYSNDSESKKHKKEKKRKKKEKEIISLDLHENRDIDNLGNNCENDANLIVRENEDEINDITDKIKKKKKKKRKKKENDD